MLVFISVRLFRLTSFTAPTFNSSSQPHLLPGDSAAAARLHHRHTHTYTHIAHIMCYTRIYTKGRVSINISNYTKCMVDIMHAVEG